MSPTLTPVAAIVAVIVVVILGLRLLPNRVRIAIDIVCFLAITAFLLKRGISPVFPPLDATIDGTILTLRALGGAWWLLGARISVAVFWFTLHRNRRSRAARLFSAPTASIINGPAAMVVLNSGRGLPLSGPL